MHELGYWLTPDVWGRGYATEAGRAVVQVESDVVVPVAADVADRDAQGKDIAELQMKRAMAVCDELGARDLGAITRQADLLVAAVEPHDVHLVTGRRPAPERKRSQAHMGCGRSVG